MKILGIIAEYNPFHMGHKYQIKKAKELDEKTEDGFEIKVREEDVLAANEFFTEANTKFTLNNEKYTVRLVGVDTPESVHPNKEKNTVEGKIASDYTKSRLQDKNVYVQKDVSGTDRYRKTIIICIFGRWYYV